MSRVTRDQFLSDFKNGEAEISVKDISSETLERLKKAGVDRSDLARIAGKDGKISGNAEYTRLYNYVDGFEDNNSNADFETRDSKNALTTSGEVYEALKSEVSRNLTAAKMGRTQSSKAKTPAKAPAEDLFQKGSPDDIKRAKDVLKNSPAVSSKEPHAQHVAKVAADLKKQGLPTSAKGVSVIVMGEADTDHAAAVTRTIAGPAGLAKDATVHLQKDGGFRDQYVKNHKYVKEVGNEPQGTTMNVNQLAKLGLVRVEASLYAATQEIGGVRKNLPADGKTRIGNISWGQSQAAIAAEMAGLAQPGMPIFKRAQLEWEMKNKTKLDPTDSLQVAEVRIHLAQEIAKEMNKLQNEPANQTNMKQLQSNLENELSASRKQGLLVFNAAGNDREVAKIFGDESLSTVAFDSVKGLITVGAADLKKPKDAKDDIMWEGSATGKKIDIAAPGVNIPVGVNNKKAVTMLGTSFSSPYAASVAALMVAANPKITPDQIEAILKSGKVTTDLPGNTDGKGLLDPVKAVLEAKKLTVN